MEEQHVPGCRGRIISARLGMWLCFPIRPSMTMSSTVVADKFEASVWSRFWELDANQYRVVSDRAIL